MKRYYAALTLVLAMSLTGCFKQDLSDCNLEENCELIFHFKNDNNGAEFKNKIFKVDAAIFDANNRYVTHKSVEKAELDKFTGIRFTLAPGEYRVVCWANITDNTDIRGDKTVSFGDFYLETTSPETGCPLYYGPAREVSEAPGRSMIPYAGSERIDTDAHKVVIKFNERTVKNIEFTRAHRKISVYVAGYRQMIEPAAPSIQLTNLPYRCNFLLRTDHTRKNFESTPKESETPEGKMLLSSFMTPISSFSDNMFLNVIRASDGVTETTFNLKEWIEENKDQIADINEFRILVQYGKDGEVKIFINSWGDIEVEPEWPD